MEEDTLAVADTAAAAIGTVKDAGMSALEETRSIFHIDEIRRCWKAETEFNPQASREAEKAGWADAIGRTLSRKQ